MADSNKDSNVNKCFIPPMEYARQLSLRKAVETTYVRIKPVQDLSLTGSLSWAARAVGLQQASKAEGVIITPTITYNGKAYRFKVHATIVPYVLVADFTRNGLYTVTVNLKLRGVDPKTGKTYDNPYSPLLAEQSGIGKIIVVWTAFGDEDRTQPLAWGFKVYDASNTPASFTIDIQEEIAAQGKVGTAVRGYRLEVWAVPNIDLPSYQTFATQVQAPDTIWENALGRILAARFILLSALEGTDDATSAVFILKSLGAELEEAGVSKEIYLPLLELSTSVIDDFRDKVSSMGIDVPSSLVPGIYEAGSVDASIPKAPQVYKTGGKIYLKLPGGLKVSDTDFLQVVKDLFRDYTALKTAVYLDIYKDSTASPDASLLATAESLAQSIPIFGSYAGLLLAGAGAKASLTAQSVLGAVSEEIRKNGKDAVEQLLSAVNNSVARLGGITELGPTFPAVIGAELEDSTWITVIADLGAFGSSVYLPDQAALPLRYEFSSYLGIKRVAVYGLFDAVDLTAKVTDAKISWKIEDSQVAGKKTVVIELDYTQPVFLVGEFPGDPFGASLFLIPGTNTITIDEDLEEEWRQFLNSAEPYGLAADVGTSEEYEDPDAQMTWDNGPIIVPLKNNYVVKYGWDLQVLGIMKAGEGLSSTYVYAGAKYGLASFKDPAEDSFWLAKWYQEKDGLFSTSFYQNKSERCQPGDSGCPIVAKDGGYGLDISSLESKLGGEFILVLAKAVPRFVPSIPPAPETAPVVVWFSRRIATISSWYADDTASRISLTVERGIDTSINLYLQPLIYKEVKDPSTGEVKVVPTPIYSPVKASVTLPNDISEISIAVKFSSDVDSPKVSVNGTSVVLTLPNDIEGQYFGLSIRAVSPTLNLPVLPARALNTVANVLWKTASAVYGAVDENGQLTARVVESQLPPASTYDSEKDEVILPFGSFKPYELLLLKQYALFIEGDMDALFGDPETVSRETRTKTPSLYAVWFASYYGPAVDVLVQDYANMTNKTPTVPALVSSAQQVIAQIPDKVASVLVLRKPSEVQVKASGIGTNNEVITLTGDGRTKLAVDVAVRTALATSSTGFTQTVVLTDTSPVKQVPVNDIAYVSELYTVVGYAEDPDNPDRSLVEWASDLLAQKREELNIPNAVSSPTVVATLASELVKKAAKLYEAGKIDFATFSALMRFMMGYVPMPVEADLRADGLAVFGSLITEESGEPPAVDGVKLTYWIGGGFDGAIQEDPEDPGKAYETVAQKLFAEVKDKIVAFASGSITDPGEAYAVFDGYTEYQIEGKTYSGYQIVKIGYTVPSTVRKAPDTTEDSLIKEIVTGAITSAVERTGTNVLSVDISYIKPTLSPIQSTKLNLTYWSTAESIAVPVLFYEISSLGIGLPKWSYYQIVGSERWFVGLWLAGIKGYVTTSEGAVNPNSSYVYVIDSQEPTKPAADSIKPVQPKASAVPVLPAGFTSPISFSVQLSDAGSFGQLLQTEINGERIASPIAWVTDGTAVRHFPDWDKDLSKESLVSLPRSLPTAGMEVLIQLNADIYAGIRDAVAVVLNNSGEVLPAYTQIDFNNIQGQAGTYKVLVNPDGSKEIVGTAGWSYTIYQKEVEVGGASGVKMSMAVADQYKASVTGTSAVNEGETSEGYEKQFMVSFSISGLPDGLLTSEDMRVAVRMRTYSPAGIRTSSWEGSLESTAVVINWTEDYDKDGNLVSVKATATGLKSEEGVSEDYAEYLKSGVLSPDQTTGPASFEMVLTLQTKDDNGNWVDAAPLGRTIVKLPPPVITAACSDDKKSFTVEAAQLSYARKIGVKGCFIAVPYEGGYSCAESCLTVESRKAEFSVSGGEPLVGAYSAYDPLTKATYDARIVCSKPLIGGVKSGSYVVVATEYPGVVVPDMYIALAKSTADKLYLQEFISDLIQLSALPYAVSVQPDADILCSLTSADTITPDDAYKLLGVSQDALPEDAAVEIAQLLVKAAKDSGDCKLTAYAGWQAMLGVVPTDLLTKARVLAGYLNQRGAEAHTVAPGINFMVVKDPASDYYFLKMTANGSAEEQLQSTLLVSSEGLTASASPSGACIGTGGGVEEEVSPLAALGPVDELATSGGEFIAKLTGNDPTKNTLVVALPILAALVLAAAGTTVLKTNKKQQ